MESDIQRLLLLGSLSQSFTAMFWGGNAIMKHGTRNFNGINEVLLHFLKYNFLNSCIEILVELLFITFLPHELVWALRTIFPMMIFLLESFYSYQIFAGGIKLPLFILVRGYMKVSMLMIINRLFTINSASRFLAVSFYYRSIWNLSAMFTTIMIESATGIRFRNGD